MGDLIRDGRLAAATSLTFALAWTLACGGAGSDAPWSAVVLPDGATVVSDSPERRVVEYAGPMSEVMSAFPAAIEAAGCGSRLYPDTWDQGLLGLYVCQDSWFHVRTERGEPITLTFEPTSRPAPVPLPAEAPWASDPARRAALALTAPLECPARNYLAFAPDGTVSGGDPEVHDFTWRGRWTLDGDDLLVTGALVATGGEEVDPADDPGPPPRCDGAWWHTTGTAPRTQSHWLCTDHVMRCEGVHAGPAVWVLVHGDPAARDWAARSIVSLWKSADDALVVAGGEVSPATGVEVRWRPDPDPRGGVDAHEKAALEVASLLERDLSIPGFTVARDPAAEAPVVVSVAPDVGR